MAFILSVRCSQILVTQSHIHSQSYVRLSRWGPLVPTDRFRALLIQYAPHISKLYKLTDNSNNTHGYAHISKIEK